MSKARFKPEQFTSTRFTPATKKARIANAIVRFIESGFDADKFTPEVYKGLMYMFGHIAHFNGQGFFSCWFRTTATTLDWLVYVQNQPIYGDPTYTLMDVEKAIQSYIFTTDLVYKYEQKVAAELEAYERAELARLRSKYEGENK